MKLVLKRCARAILPLALYGGIAFVSSADHVYAHDLDCDGHSKIAAARL